MEYGIANTSMSHHMGKRKGGKEEDTTSRGTRVGCAQSDEVAPVLEKKRKREKKKEKSEKKRKKVTT